MNEHCASRAASKSWLQVEPEMIVEPAAGVRPVKAMRGQCRARRRGSDTHVRFD
jgi:hypothetical protein